MIQNNESFSINQSDNIPYRMQYASGLLGFALLFPIQAQTFSFDDAQTVLKTFCQNCHQGKSPAARLDITRYATAESVIKEPQTWNRILLRVREGSMPPKGVPAPTADQRERFSALVESSLRTAVCAAGISPGPAPIRRLNRNQYSTTIRDLLNIQFNAGRALPEDGAGGEGFDNAAETLFLSPIHAEKYLEAAKETLNFAFKDPRTRQAILIATEPSEQSARKILAAFLPRAFRRPSTDAEIEKYLRLYRAAQKRGDTFGYSVQYALQGVLISPQFLFRIEEPNTTRQQKLLDDYALAARLSYFLWDSMPDQELFALAAAGKLNDPETLKKQIVRMLDPGVRGLDDNVRIIKGGKVEAFAEQFIGQWLGIRELGRDIKPDAKLFPEYYEPELQSAIHYEPVLFFKQLLISNLSLLNLLDSKFTMLNNKLQQHYGFKLKVGQQPAMTDLPENSHRGGLLGMAAVLAVSSYPNRTSPVLRGKWVLESLLGTPPPPPPPSVPALEEVHEGSPAKTVRVRLEQHRQNPACSGCHNRIDPLGFGLENYDVLGRWRLEDSGAAVDAKGELPDGTIFNGPEEFKAVLLSRKDVFIRNLVSKTLGYALGRGLKLEDSCTIDRIAEQLRIAGYKAQTLVEEIVLSVPFRYQESAK
jgi:hypothetical protein